MPSRSRCLGSSPTNQTLNLLLRCRRQIDWQKPIGNGIELSRGNRVGSSSVREGDYQPLQSPPSYAPVYARASETSLSYPCALAFQATANRSEPSAATIINPLKATFQP